MRRRRRTRQGGEEDRISREETEVEGGEAERELHGAERRARANRQNGGTDEAWRQATPREREERERG